MQLACLVPVLQRAAALLAMLGCGGAAAAEPGGLIEVGALHHALTANLGQWNDQSVRGNLRTADGSLWHAELLHARRFNDSGTLVALGHTRHFGEQWYGSAAIASSSGGFFFPSLRLDLTANRKWGARRQWVSTAGVTIFNAKDGHRDRTVLLGLSYYFEFPLMLQGGVRINRSDPGAVGSRTQFVAATYGTDQQRIISLMHGFGDEAYQLIGPGAVLVGLDSRVDTLTWRQWVRPKHGFQVRAEHYSSAFYRRRGVEVSLFKEF